MDHAITVLDIVWTLGIAAAILVPLGLGIWFLSILANGFNR